MSDDNFRKLRETMERRALRPASVQFDEMVRRGALDREGNVTIRRPEAPVTGRPAEDTESSNGDAQTLP